MRVRSFANGGSIPRNIGHFYRYVANKVTEPAADKSERLQWWFWPYWLLCMILSPLIFAVLLIVAIVSVPLEFIYRLKQNRREKDMCARLVSEGRFVQWSDIESQLQSGTGTLIVQHRSPKGPVRDWWTEDDIIGDAPLLLPGALAEMPAETDLAKLQAYARQCCERYLDEDNGSARLTQVPVPRSVAIDPRKYTTVHLADGLMTAIILPRGREMANKYPTANVVTVIEWFGDPVMAAGDAEAVFLNAT